MSVIDSKMSQKGSNDEGNMSIKKSNLVRPGIKTLLLPGYREKREEMKSINSISNTGCLQQE
jgi:hypothetical protein